MTVDEVVTTLLDLGFVPAGETRQEHVRIPTMKSPVFGGSGGERRTLGGRARYALPGTDLRVTVGPRTTNVYYSRGAGKTEFVLNEHTKHLTEQALRDAVASATGARPGHARKTAAQLDREIADALREPTRHGQTRSQVQADIEQLRAEIADLRQGPDTRDKRDRRQELIVRLEDRQADLRDLNIEHRRLERERLP